MFVVVGIEIRSAGGRGLYGLLSTITAEHVCRNSLCHELSSFLAWNHPWSSCHSCIFDETLSPYISKLWLVLCSHYDVLHVCGWLRFHLLSFHPYILFMKGCGWWSCAILIRSAFYEDVLATPILIHRHTQLQTHESVSRLMTQGMLV